MTELFEFSSISTCGRAYYGEGLAFGYAGISGTAATTTYGILVTVELIVSSKMLLCYIWLMWVIYSFILLESPSKSRLISPICSSSSSSSIIILPPPFTVKLLFSPPSSTSSQSSSSWTYYIGAVFC
jgi:hypothetical protein